MRTSRLYTNQALHSGSRIALEAAPTHYLVKVLRMSAGHKLILFNGRGGEFEATIESLEKKSASLHVGEFFALNRLPSIQVELAICLSRGEKMDWVIQKSTELGVNKISPLFSERTEVKLGGGRQAKKLEHWRNIAIAACEQSRRNLLPDICPPNTIAELISGTSSQLKLLFHPETTNSFKDIIQAMHTPPSSVLLLIGPEGGFSDTEINLSLRYGFKSLALGPRVLRAETAPITALSIIQQFWGDFDV